MNGESEVDDVFLKATLYTQVFKISTALSVIKLCPKGVDVAEFTIALQKAYRNCKKLKDDIFYQFNSLRIFPVANEDHESSFEGRDSLRLSSKSLLSKWCGNVSSIRIGMLGMLKRDESIFRESDISPIFSVLLQISLRVSTFNIYGDTSLEFHRCSIIKDIKHGLKLVGQCCAILEKRKALGGVMTANLNSIVSVICVPRNDKNYDFLLPLVAIFLTSYAKFLSEIGRPVVANALTILLLNLLLNCLRIPPIDSDTQPHKLNEAFARIYTYLLILLGCFQHRGQFDPFLTERAIAVQKAIDEMNQGKTTKETWLSNGSFCLLHTLNNKLRGIRETLM